MAVSKMEGDEGVDQYFEEICQTEFLKIIEL
jgi:hypothetical protein